MFVVITQLALLGMAPLVIAEGNANTFKSVRGVEDQYEVSSAQCVCPLLRSDLFGNAVELCTHAYMEAVPMF